MNFFDIFISLNEDQKKILLENHAQKLISDIQSFDDCLEIIEYLNDEQLSMAFQRYPIELNAELLNHIAKTVSLKNLTNILNFNAKKLFGGQLSAQEMNSFLSQADKKIQNYLIKYQVKWLMQNVSNADELLEFILILNNRSFIEKQIDIIKEYVTEPSVFYSYRKILSEKTPKLNQVFIKTFYPSFNESAHQQCLTELGDYEKILNKRVVSFFTVQSKNKNKIRHVRALMAILNGEAPDCRTTVKMSQSYQNDFVTYVYGLT